MKNIFGLLFLFLICVGSASSQPVITSAINPEVGDSYSGYSIDTNAIDISLTGANITWDLSTFSVSPTAISTVTGQAPSSTASASSYTSSNVALSDAVASTSTYFITSSSEMDFSGVVSSSSTTVLTNPATLITFPFTYNSTVSDNLAGTQSVGIATFNVTGTSNSIADAYGTLILPTATYNDVLRVKITQNSVSSPVGGTINTHLVTYYWYSTLYKEQLLEVDVSTTSGTGLYASSASSYTKKALVIASQLADVQSVKENEKNNFNAVVFPNPSINRKSTLSFSLNEASNVSISLINAIGQEKALVINKQMTSGLQNETIDLSGLSAGIYFTKLNVNGTISLKKLIIN